MAIRIRTFLNTDTPHLAQLWRQHHEAAGLRASCPSNVWEYCVLAKPYFDSSSLWIALEEDRPVGFLHAACAGNLQRSDLDPGIRLVNSLCVRPCEHEQEIARELLQAATGFLRASSESAPGLVLATSSPDHYAFYLGIAHGDGLLGVPTEDVRLQAWLRSYGFVMEQSTEVCSLDLPSFRPPMDRTQIQVRRQCSVSRVLDFVPQQWWIATAIGHTEQVGFQLVSRTVPVVSMMAIYWHTDPTVPGLEQGATNLWLPQNTTDRESEDRLVFLLSESLRQLQQDRISTVRAVAPLDESGLASVLSRLGFRAEFTGQVYRLL